MQLLMMKAALSAHYFLCLCLALLVALVLVCTCVVGRTQLLKVMIMRLKIVTKVHNHSLEIALPQTTKISYVRCHAWAMTIVLQRSANHHHRTPVIVISNSNYFLSTWYVNLRRETGHGALVRSEKL